MTLVTETLIKAFLYGGFGAARQQIYTADPCDPPEVSEKC